jgi:hypothetical protein
MDDQAQRPGLDITDGTAISCIRSAQIIASGAVNLSCTVEKPVEEGGVLLVVMPQVSHTLLVNPSTHYDVDNALSTR